jgi:quercetin dioxygenase-like cupin family protein
MLLKRLTWGLIATMPLAVGADDADFVRVAPDDLVWTDSDTPGLSFAVLAGDPQQAGFYLIRARFQPGVMSSPHYHPTDRHVTVISGVWHTGTGESFDRDDTVGLHPGAYMFHPAGAVHYDGAKDQEVIVEIKGIGPAPTIRVGE